MGGGAGAIPAALTNYCRRLQAVCATYIGNTTHLELPVATATWRVVDAFLAGIRLCQFANKRAIPGHAIDDSCRIQCQINIPGLPLASA